MLSLTYFLGDIHGCYDELLRLEARIAVHAKRRARSPLFVAVGDLIDRGPKSADVVRHFRQGEQARTHAAILGNHEAMMLQCLASLAPRVLEGAGAQLRRGLKTFADLHAAQTSAYARSLTVDEYAQFQRFAWIGQGGAETLKSFGVDPSAAETWTGLDPHDVAYLARLPLFWEDAHGVATHALAEAEDLACLRAPGEPDIELRIWDILARRKMPTARPDFRRLHISGHTPMNRPRKRKALGIAQIDTGCVFGGALTAYCPETDDYLSVKRAK